MLAGRDTATTLVGMTPWLSNRWTCAAVCAASGPGGRSSPRDAAAQARRPSLHCWLCTALRVYTRAGGGGECVQASGVYNARHAGAYPRGYPAWFVARKQWQGQAAAGGLPGPVFTPFARLSKNLFGRAHSSPAALLWQVCLCCIGLHCCSLCLWPNTLLALWKQLFLSIDAVCVCCC